MAAVAANRSGRWLYGPVPDLLIGCGLWYALALMVLSFAGEAIRAGGGMLLVPFAVLLFSTPHYGATLLRVYEQREDRRAYALFAVHATLLLAVLFAVGVHSAVVGSWILTAYVTWSPWHYTGQNYGLAVMFLRRRGISLDAVTQRWIYASFILSYGLTLLALHGGGEASHFVPFGHTEVSYRFINLGIPPAVTGVALPVLTVGYLGALGVSARRLLQRGRAVDLLPAAALAATQALWFSVPHLLSSWRVDPRIEPWTSGYGAYYFLWIAIGHSVQYVWITSWYARSGGRWSGQMPYHAKALLAGAAVWVLPTLFFAPEALGRLPYDGGLAILGASIVNLHHFVLDGAIWKLRDGRVAQILLRRRDDPPASELRPTPRSSWLARGIWATGTLCLVVMFVAKWQAEVSIPEAAASGDLAAARRAADRLAWVGRDSVKLRRRLGDAFLRRGDVDGAVAQYRRANEIRPTVTVWYEIGMAYGRDQRWREAVAAFETALERNPDETRVLYQLGLAQLELGDYAGARSSFARAAELDPERSIHRTMQERAQRALAESAQAAHPGRGPPTSWTGDGAN